MNPTTAMQPQIRFRTPDDALQFVVPPAPIDNFAFATNRPKAIRDAVHSLLKSVYDPVFDQLELAVNTSGFSPFETAAVKQFLADARPKAMDMIARTAFAQRDIDTLLKP